MKSFYTLCFLIVCQFATAQVQEATLIGRWFNDDLPGSWAYDNTYNEIWGLHVNDTEYAIIGSTAGTHFIDLSDPYNPEETFFVEGGSTGGQIIHRDYHDHKGYLYAVADEGANSTLQIIDISRLPDEIELVYDANNLIRRTHNLFIDEATDKLYTGISQGTSNQYSPLRVFDITEPANPVEIGSYSSFDNFQIGQVHDLFVRNDTAYMNCGPEGFAVAYFADMDNPITLATLSPAEYMQSGYNHSGWLSENGDYYYMADETWGTDIKVMDMRSLPDIFFTDFIDAGNENEYSIPHNQIVHDNKLYSSYYYDGLVVWDLDNPAEPTLSWHYATTDYPHQQNYEGAWGVYPFLPSGLVLVSDMQYGLFVLNLGEFSNTDDITEAENIEITPNPNSGSFNFKTPDLDGQEAKINMYNTQGQLVYSKTMVLGSKNQIISNLSNGSYLLKIETGWRTFQSKVFIMD